MTGFSYFRKRSKYGNKRTVYKGRKYDSKHEASIAQDIELLVKAGEVIKVEPQKTFPLYGKNGTRVCDMRVDFFLTFKDGHTEVYEAKAPITMTPEWHIKRKLWEDNYPETKYVILTSQGWWTPSNRRMRKKY